MNRIYSDDELNYKPRWLTPRIQAAVQDHPVVVITGARQVGKSTLLRHAEPMREWRYISMDDPDALEQAQTEPEALWAGAAAVVIDEAQKSPAIMSAIKRAVDSSGRRKMRFVVSGSANLLLMKQVSETLAGRAVYFVLHPMTIGESLQRSAPSILTDLLAGTLPEEGTPPALPSVDIPEWMLRGFMPPLFELTRPEAWTQWWEGYVATYLERDLRQIANIEALTDFRRVMQLAALRTGQLLNQTEVARDARVSQPTAHRYLSLIEATHLAQRLPAYSGNRGAQVIKSPKMMWSDPGLAIYLAGYYDTASLARGREYGSIFETLIYHHLNVLAQLLTPKPSLFYWRTVRGVDVDFVVERGRQCIAIEVKLTATARYADAAGLQAFMAQHSNAVAGVLLYTGTEIKRLGAKIVALPWQMFT